MNIQSPVPMDAGPAPAQVSNSETVVNTPKKQSKPDPQHKDKLGRLIRIGDFVAYPESNSLCVGTIVKLNPKMIKVARINKYRWESNKYPDDCVKLEQSDMTWYILKNS